jgi:membrane-bound serine protease (ClpP class)
LSGCVAHTPKEIALKEAKFNLGNKNMKCIQIIKNISCFNLLTIFLLLFIFGSGGWADNTKTVYVAQIDDEIINPITTEYLINAIDKAETDNAECLIIELDTPGGLLSSTRLLVKKIMNARVPVVVYVYPRGARAGSAGVFITLAANIAAMAPSTNIGAAHPVDIGGNKDSDGNGLKDLLNYFKQKDKPESVQKKPAEQKQNRPNMPQKGSETPGKEESESNPMAEKIMNDTIAWVTTIARQRGRNVDWAVRAVRESISDSEDEALKAGVIDLIAENIDDLLKKLNGRTVKTVDREYTLNTSDVKLSYILPTLRDKILRAISNPNIAYFLMLFGFYGLLYEFTHPGIGFPGIAGAICLILALYSFQSLPINYAGLILIVLGIILFIAEAKVISYGLLTLGGAVCMLLGSLMLFNSPYEFLRVSLTTVLPLVISTALITIFLMGAVFRSHARKVVSGPEGLIGEKGEAKTDIAPKGKVFVHGELWDAESTDRIAKGDLVEVIGIEGLKIKVKKQTR